MINREMTGEEYAAFMPISFKSADRIVN